MNRTDIYQKYVVKRSDGNDDPKAIYFVLRVDRVDDKWDQLCRWTLRNMQHRLMSDGDPVMNKFGENLMEWINNIYFEGADAKELREGKES